MRELFESIVRRYVRFLLAMALAAGAGCSFSDTSRVEHPIERIVIIDDDGLHWDITQAVIRYGFDKDLFFFGLGAFAIPPLTDPIVVSPGQKGYPPPDSTFEVIGTFIATQARAYSTNDLSFFEVIDDNNNGVPVAVVFRPLRDEFAIFHRAIADSALTLSASGWVYDDQSVLYDYETRSLWYQLSGSDVLTCINGPLLARELRHFGGVRQSWAMWRGDNPGTQMVRYPARQP